MMHRSLAISGVLLFGFFSRDSHAALGGDTASIEADRVMLGATHEITKASTWELHVLRLSSGSSVREWVSPGGKVFAVAWSGPTMPDLRHLLGVYFEPYVNSPRLTPAQHHSHVVSNADWVVQSAGHPEAFLGRAWLTSQLPKGFDLDTVRAW